MFSVKDDIKKRWQQAYKNGFFVARNTPSLICQELSYYLELPGKILDVGCGTGRNSIFFARMGYDVEAIDVVNSISDEYRGHGLIDFKEAFAEDYNMQKDDYLAVVATRFLHNVDDDTAAQLLKKWSAALKEGGYLCLSFIVANISYEKVKEYDLPYYYHDTERLIKEAEKLGFNIVAKKYVNKIPSAINRARKNLTDSFEIIFVKR